MANRTSKQGHNTDKDELAKLLQNLNTSGSVFWHAISDDLRNPGVYINGFGHLGLPITEVTAKALLKHCQTTDAPLATAKSAVFDHEQLVFTNPKWPAYLGQIRTRIDDALCVGTDLSLTNPRLLLCSSNANPNEIVRQYTDNLSFGRLLIRLPSVHNGLKISYSGFNGLISAPVVNKDDFSSVEAAWFHDTSCQLVTTGQGHLAVLMYDIAQASPNSVDAAQRASSAAQVWQQLSGFGSALYGLMRSAGGKYLAIPLAKDYHADQLKEESLEAKDRTLLSFVRTALERTKYGVFLGDISLQRTTTSAHWRDTEVEETIHLSCTIPIAENMFTIHSKLKKSWIIHEALYRKDRIASRRRVRRSRPENPFGGSGPSWDLDDGYMYDSEDYFLEGYEKEVSEDFNDSHLNRVPDYMMEKTVEHAWRKRSPDMRLSLIQQSHQRAKSKAPNDDDVKYLEDLCDLMLMKLENDHYHRFPDKHAAFTEMSPSSDLQLIAALIEATIEAPGRQRLAILKQALRSIDWRYLASAELIARIIAVVDFESVSTTLDNMFEAVQGLKARHDSLTILEKACKRELYKLEDTKTKFAAVHQWVSRRLAEYCEKHPVPKEPALRIETLKTLAKIAIKRQSTTFMSKFLDPEKDESTLLALLQGFVKCHENAYAGGQIPAIVQVLRTKLEAKRQREYSSCFYMLVCDCGLEPAMADEVLETMKSLVEANGIDEVWLNVTPESREVTISRYQKTRAGRQVAEVLNNQKRKSEGLIDASRPTKSNTRRAHESGPVPQPGGGQTSPNASQLATQDGSRPELEAVVEPRSSSHTLPSTTSELRTGPATREFRPLLKADPLWLELGASGGVQGKPRSPG